MSGVGDERDVLTVDYTTLRGVAECSTKAGMVSVLHLQPTGTRLPLEAGIAVHAALATWLETQSVAQALTAFEAYYRPLWDKAVKGNAVPPEHERLEFGAVRRILQHWVKTRTGTGVFPYSLESGLTEVAVVKDLGEIGGEPVRYVALIDAVLKSRVGGRWLCDHKSTSSLGPWWEEQQETSGQFVGQRWAGEESLGEIEGVLVNGMAIPRLNSSSKKCYKHGVPYAECALEHCEAKLKVVMVTAKEQEAFAQTVTKMVKKYQRIRRQVGSVEDIVQQPMEGRLNGACRICDYRDWCKVGRPTSRAVIRRGFEERVWDPLAEAKARRVRARA